MSLNESANQIIKLLNQYFDAPDNIQLLTQILSDRKRRTFAKQMSKFRQIPEQVLISAITDDLPEATQAEIKSFFADSLYLEGFEEYGIQPESTEEVVELRSMKWYRGVSYYPLHDVTTGRPESAVFITNDILQAATYAGEEGFIAEFSLGCDFFTRRHQPSFGADFSPLTYHDEANSVKHHRELIIARNVRDSGQFLDFIGLGGELAKSHYRDAINLCMHSRNKILKLESLRPSKEVVMEHLSALAPAVESKVEQTVRQSKMQIKP
ncbi:hypothetical protein OTK49_01100 [Vibrio coralliirubri]|uniref:hypothetical protein n=1 Tax=Vibrio coralliirubri TaxID=1516159 RepID=UPI0022847CB7|nr:hypothetical protein [Vibrio coralliirubri]MCY9861126.1 hypothetical protein [Vibrio coralliirubri]